MSDKKPNKFNKITKIVIWLMLIAIVGSAVIGAVVALANFL